jgi:uncharacterized protein (TIGR00369 family)
VSEDTDAPEGASPASAPATLTDAEMLARFRGARRRPPCSETLGLDVTHIDQARQLVRATFTASPAFANPSGAIQGGFVAAMLDETMSICATLEMKVSFLKPLFAGAAVCEARILKWGRSICFIEGELYNPEGELVAKASATQAPKPFRRL